MAKLVKNENVTMDVLVEICTAIYRDSGDVMEFTVVDNNQSNERMKCNEFYTATY